MVLAERDGLGVGFLVPKGLRTLCLRPPGYQMIARVLNTQLAKTMRCRMMQVGRNLTADSAYGGQVRQKYGGFVERLALIWYNIDWLMVK